ncbi:hypothetical protein ACXO2T_06490 [Lactobacillus delbrueckii subsp. bulgaricus]
MDYPVACCYLDWCSVAGCGLIWLRILTGLRIRISEDGGQVPEAES